MAVLRQLFANALRNRPVSKLGARLNNYKIWAVLDLLVKRQAEDGVFELPCFKSIIFKPLVLN